jgi:hypothetical protein
VGSTLTLGNGANGKAANYNITTTSMTTTANITPKALTLSSISAVDKTFDGNANAMITGGVFVGLVSSETLSLSGAGVFDSFSSGQGKVVTVTNASSLNLANGSNGGKASNYTLSGGPITTTANINGIPITITINPKVKKFNEGDPEFTYTTSDNLNGELITFTRVPGDRAGRYAILASHPNFEITVANLAEAFLVIEAPLGKPVAEIANDVSNNTASNVATGFSLGTSAVNPAARVSSAGVRVELLKRPELQETGVVSVSLPANKSAAGAGLSFALPNELMSSIANAVNVEARLTNGDPLPSWLRFDNTNGQFVVSEVADVSFPLELSVQLGNQQVLVVISDRQD